ncbi:glyoxalase [Providencia stuartii]|uniref:glyoxalase n=1 Tax=Providencia stuartii TaxID=588 RepID=UPI0013D38A99|nr:glyoxalase [Providencia stuartii]
MLSSHQASEILFVAGFGPITREPNVSYDFYVKTLGLPLKAMEGNQDYFTNEEEQLSGVKHFALWPLSQAAQSCFGVDHWPETHLVPQSWIEFEVANLSKATQCFINEGYSILVNERMEPWGQMVTRLLSPEGMLVGLTVTPWLRE